MAPKKSTSSGISDNTTIAGIDCSSCNLIPDACQTTTSDEEFHTVFKIVKAKTGHDFSSYKANTVMRRIERRMMVNEVSGIGQYVALLQENPNEAHALCRDILIGVTSFFRDPDAFEALRSKVIPQLFENRHPDGPVRIWHACCATGEEVYSMAILIREYLRERKLSTDIQLFASDIDETAIAQARAGVYNDDSVADLGKERLKTFFIRSDGRWQVTKSLRESIVFSHHSLIRDPPFSRLDLLVCRNFLIYLNPDMQKRLYSLFHQVLRPGGFLFLGSAESVGHNSELFTILDKKSKIFVRRETKHRTETLYPLSASVRIPGTNRPVRTAGLDEPTPGTVAERLLMERYSPPCVVVNEKYEVIHVSTRPVRFLEVPVGEPTRDILKMAREELRPALRSAIYKAFAEQSQVVFRGVKVADYGGEISVNITVEPLNLVPSAGKALMVIFEPTAPSVIISASTGGEELHSGDETSKDMLIRQMEEQLRITHEQLQATTEQLESSNEGFMSANEELMSINEEFQSANEELQSTNEELETSKEELQALNEELATVNAELQVKVEELDQATSDMENLLNSSEIACLFLDRLMNIKGFTPAAAEVFNLIQADIGRPFRHFAGKIDWPTLTHDAETVLSGQPFAEREVTTLNRRQCYLKRIFPYRTPEGSIDGIVVSLTDITERKKAEVAHARLAAIVESSDDAVIGKDRNGIITDWNDGAERLFGYSAKEIIGRTVTLLIPPELLYEEEMIQQQIAAGQRIEHYETVRLARDGQRIEVSVTVSPIKDGNGRIIGTSKIARDITERKQAERALHESEEQFHTLADAIPQLCWMANADGWIFWYNRRWYEYTGSTPDQMEGWGWQSVHDPGILPKVIERWQASIATGRPFEMIFPLRGADGEFRPFLTQVMPVCGQDGMVARWFGTNTDISEQLNTEEALRRSDERYRTLFNTLIEGFCIIEVLFDVDDQPVDYRFLEINNAFEAQTGLRDAKGKLMRELAPEHEAHWFEIYGKVALTGESAHFVNEAKALNRWYDVTAYRVDGQNSRKVAILFNDITEIKKVEEKLQNAHDELEQRVAQRTQELAHTVNLLQEEISEREKAKKSLHRLNRLYAVLSETNQTIVRVTDRDSLFRDFCRIAVEHGGFLLAWVGLIDKETGRVVMAASHGTTGYLDDIRISANSEPDGEGPTGISIREGTYHICNDFQNDPCTRPWHEKGYQHGIHASASIALKEEDHVIGALTLYAGEKNFFDQQHVGLLRKMGTDVSFALANLKREADRRKVEQALREETLERLRAVEALREKEQLLIQQNRMAAMGEMIGNIAHQWRQPLNTLGLIVQELAMSFDFGMLTRENLNADVTKAKHVINHMSRTIDDFRNFFRADKEKVSFKVNDIVTKAVSLIAESFREQCINIEISAQEDIFIYGYPNEFSQVILNILVNARDAFADQKKGEPGNVLISLFTEDDKAVITLADNAGGIAEDIMMKIFDPYFTTKGPDKGTGVGLFMSKTIIEKNMGGKVSACNTGNGAEFRIEV